MKKQSTQLVLPLNQADDFNSSEDFIRRNESPRTPIKRGYGLSIPDNKMRGRSRSVPNKSAMSGGHKDLPLIDADNEDGNLIKDNEPPRPPRRQSNIGWHDTINEETTANEASRPRQQSMLNLPVSYPDNNQRMEINPLQHTVPVAPHRQPANSFSRVPLSPTRNSKHSTSFDNGYDHGSKLLDPQDNKMKRRNSELPPVSNFDRYSSDLSIKGDSSSNLSTRSRSNEVIRSTATVSIDQPLRTVNEQWSGRKSGRSNSRDDDDENFRGEVKSTKLINEGTKPLHRILTTDQRTRRRQSRPKRNNHAVNHHESDSSMSGEDDQDITIAGNQIKDSESDEERHNTYDNHSKHEVSNMPGSNRRISSDVRLNENYQSQLNRGRFPTNRKMPDFDHNEITSDSNNKQQHNDLQYSQQQLPSSSHDAEFRRFHVHSKDVDYV